MDKLYWIVCEESDKTLFEGRFLGRTRGAALKHLKDQLGRASLNGLVFTITEIPVPLIREIVAEMLNGNEAVAPVVETRPSAPPRDPEPPTRFDGFSTPEVPSQPEDGDPPPSGATTRRKTDYDWAAIKACYMEGRSPKDVSKIMKVPVETLRKRATREGWAKERREGGK